MKEIPSFCLQEFSLNHTSDLVFWSDLNGQLIYANQVVADTLGYPLTDLLKKYAWEIIVGGGQQGWAKQKQLLCQKKYFSLPVTYRQANGRPFLTQTKLHYLEEGESYICAIATPQASDARPAHLAELTHQTLNQIQDIIIWSKPNGALMYFNEAVFTQLGYTQEEFKQLKRSEFIQNYDKKKQAHFRTILETQESFLGECILRRKDGNLLHAEINTTVVFYAGALMNCTIFRDISLRKAAEEKLLKQQLEFKNIIHSTTDAIVTTDKEGNILLWNRGAERLFGWRYDEVYQASIDIIVSEQFQSKYPQGMVHFMKTNQPTPTGKTVELEGIRADETIFPMAVSLSSWQDEEGDYFCSIIRDVSPQKAKEQALKNLLAENLKLKSVLEEENTSLQTALNQVITFDQIITVSEKYKQVLTKVEEVAATDTMVLISGETGTRKELLARAIHRKSKYANQPFFAINCTDFSDSLLGSELFGHEEGAFPNANKRVIGLLEKGNDATVLLHEVSELSTKVQAKLLRFIKTGEFSRIGGTETIISNVRLIVTTNKNLSKLTKAGTFRKDLYYQMNVFPINSLPLRERKEDIPLLTKHFMKKIGERLGRKVPKISKRTLKKLTDYDYPGNIVELENILERAIILSKGATLIIRGNLEITKSKDKTPSTILSLAEIEKQHIISVLRQTHGKISGQNGAAQLLDLHPNTLSSKIKKLKIDKKDYLK